MTTKTCNKCNLTKELEEFIRNKATKDGYRPYCKLCQRIQQKEYYQRNKVNRNTSVALNVKRYRKKLASEIDALKCKPCMDCGVKYPPYVMDFDHRDPKDKVESISVLVLQRNISKARVLEEIAKCDLVCSNCHRERTHHRRVAQ